LALYGVLAKIETLSLDLVKLRRLLLVGGRLGDVFSRKWVFITGLVGFALASALAGAAGSFVTL